MTFSDSYFIVLQKQKIFKWIFVFQTYDLPQNFLEERIKDKIFIENSQHRDLLAPDNVKSRKLRRAMSLYMKPDSWRKSPILSKFQSRHSLVSDSEVKNKWIYRMQIWNLKKK